MKNNKLCNIEVTLYKLCKVGNQEIMAKWLDQRIIMQERDRNKLIFGINKHDKCLVDQNTNWELSEFRHHKWI